MNAAKHIFLMIVIASLLAAAVPADAGTISWDWIDLAIEESSWITGAATYNPHTTFPTTSQPYDPCPANAYYDTLQMRCVCLKHFYLVNNVCKSGEDICAETPYAEYDKNIKDCVCKKGFKPGGSENCVPECEGPHKTFNVKTGECGCEAGFQLKNDKCIALCTVAGTKYDSSLGKCECDQGYGIKDGQCVPEAQACPLKHMKYSRKLSSCICTEDAITMDGVNCVEKSTACRLAHTYFNDQTNSCLCEEGYYWSWEARECISKSVSTTQSDSLGRVIKETRDGQTISYAYDPNGRLIMTTLGDGSTISYEYDELGLMTKEKYSSGKERSLFFDKYGRLVAAMQPGGEMDEYFYDNKGFLIKQVSSKGTETTYTYSANEQRTASVKQTIPYQTYTGNNKDLQTAYLSLLTAELQYQDNMEEQIKSIVDGIMSTCSGDSSCVASQIKSEMAKADGSMLYVYFTKSAATQESVDDVFAWLASTVYDKEQIAMFEGLSSTGASAAPSMGFGASDAVSDGEKFVAKNRNNYLTIREMKMIKDAPDGSNIELMIGYKGHGSVRVPTIFVKSTEFDGTIMLHEPGKPGKKVPLAKVHEYN